MVYLPLENNLSVVAQWFTGPTTLNFIMGRGTRERRSPHQNLMTNQPLSLLTAILNLSILKFNHDLSQSHSDC
ncbi:hypothetical protein NG791_11180 [Laspinema sp. D1]|uniref:hypothetical protein n=1 Tax=Laspinema palackyanum TaxID=3231601 RepID=UPI0034713372|nr:hypothetical protein [Laspinema sp. D2b]